MIDQTITFIIIFFIKLKLKIVGWKFFPVLQVSSIHKVKSSIKWERQEAFPQLSALSRPPPIYLYTVVCHMLLRLIPKCSSII